MKIIKRVVRLCLCALLCMALAVPLMGTAFAFDGSGDESTPDITIRITPPSGVAVQSAAVEICITDNAGAGFQIAHVRAGGGSWKEVTGALEQTDNRYYCVVDITENCTVSVRVAGQDGTIFEKSEDINCFNTASSSQDTATSGTDNAETSAEPDTSSQSSTVTAPGGQGTVIDNVISGETREFFTISTPDENVFYLVIDRERESENVYFLNAVTESDLMALAEKDENAGTVGVSAIPDPEPVCICTDKCAPGEVNADCPVCVLSWKDCTGIAAVNGDDHADDGDAETGSAKKGGGAGTIILVLIAALAAGGAGYYFKIYKPKKALEDSDDFDDMNGAEEATINEDNEEPAPRRDRYAEPEEPDYPDGYGYEDDM